MDDRDRQLVRAFSRDKDEEAFAELVRRHGSMVQATCERVLGSADALDAAQAVFLTLAAKAEAMAKHPNLGGWLHQVATHISLRLRESRLARERREVVAAQEFLRQRADGDSSANLRACIDEALVALPERYRLPIILHHLEGEPPHIAAQKLGLRASAFSMRLARGCELLRRRLRAQPAAVALSLTMCGASNATELAASASNLATAGLAMQAGASLANAGPSFALAHAALQSMSVAKVKVAVVVMLAIMLAFGAMAGIGAHTEHVATVPAEAPVDDGSDGAWREAEVLFAQSNFAGALAAYVAFTNTYAQEPRAALALNRALICAKRTMPKRQGELLEQLVLEHADNFWTKFTIQRLQADNAKVASIVSKRAEELLPSCDRIAADRLDRMIEILTALQPDIKSSLSQTRTLCAAVLGNDERRRDALREYLGGDALPADASALQKAMYVAFRDGVQDAPEETVRQLLMIPRVDKSCLRIAVALARERHPERPLLQIWHAAGMLAQSDAAGASALLAAVPVPEDDARAAALLEFARGHAEYLLGNFAAASEHLTTAARGQGETFAKSVWTMQVVCVNSDQRATTARKLSAAAAATIDRIRNSKAGIALIWEIKKAEDELKLSCVLSANAVRIDYARGGVLQLSVALADHGLSLYQAAENTVTMYDDMGMFAQLVEGVLRAKFNGYLHIGDRPKDWIVDLMSGVQQEAIAKVVIPTFIDALAMNDYLLPIDGGFAWLKPDCYLGELNGGHFLLHDGTLDTWRMNDQRLRLLFLSTPIADDDRLQGLPRTTRIVRKSQFDLMKVMKELGPAFHSAFDDFTQAMSAWPLSNN
jgi:RNA polymerase sigma factor (sigma-70 family)